ncbi:MAG: hypothetical protein WCT11_05190 [Candidatus Magasanikbacteria bacterium]|jgi:hypothetical protein
MEFNFKKFEGRNVRQEDRITLTKSHSIGFPQKFYNDNNIKSFKSAVLFWDDANKAIGVLFTNDESEKNKFSIIHSKEGYGGSVVARSFLRFNNIDPKIYHGRYEWEKHNQEGVGDLFVIKLREVKESVKN